MERGRVLVVLHEGELGGASRSVLRCVPGLEERGWSFAYWVPRPSEVFDHLAVAGADVAGAERPIAYSLAALRVKPGVARRLARTPRYLAAFERRLRDVRPVLVHANSHTTLVDLCAARLRAVPSLFHVHEIFGTGRKWDAGRRLAFWAADEVVAVSDACAASLEFGGRSARVVRNGVPVPEAPSPARGERPITVGTVGVISRRKGTDVFVEAARIALDRDPSLRFELVGAPTDPLDANWAKGVLRDAAAAGIVHHEAADVAAKLREWDIFALPSRRDPFPLSSLEAMARGLPVIGAETDGISEQLAGGAGLLVAPGDPGALATAIRNLAGRPAERAALGAAARERVLAEFTIERQVEGLDAAYRAALGDGA